MSIIVRCGRRMDGSGPSLVFSSPAYGQDELINQIQIEAMRGDDPLPLTPRTRPQLGIIDPRNPSGRLGLCRCLLVETFREIAPSRKTHDHSASCDLFLCAV